mgnify:CR=1 FL=1
MKEFTFMIALTGYGETPEEAFQDAVKDIDESHFRPNDWVSYTEETGE